MTQFKQPGFYIQSGSRFAKSNVKDCPRTELGGAEPVTLDEIKDQCRVAFSDDDAILARLGIAARKSIEEYCCISIISKSVIATIDLYSELELPYGPVTADAIVLTDSNGNVIDPAFYQIIGTQFKKINSDTQFTNAVLTYKVGYTGSVEEDLKSAILNEVAFRYENRGETTDTRKGVSPGVCEAAQVLAEPYRRLIWA